MKIIVKKILAKTCYRLSNMKNGLISYYQKGLFKKCGKNVSINQNGIFTYETISIGDDVFIGANAVIQSRYAEIIIGSHVALGPGVNIYGANHDFKSVGKYMSELTEPPKKNIIIEDDCWIGANVIILKGVHIGKGSVIGAGTILSYDIPPYSIVYGDKKI